jgi:DNA-binding transcriptional LysR family regulator
MNRTPDRWQWDDVRVFLAVARSGSLSAAARTLGIGHVTVGRRLAVLEQRLQATLLARTPDGLETTSAGDAILRQCVAMEAAAQDLERIAAGRDAQLAGVVRLTTTEALAQQVVVPAIVGLRRAHPDLQIDLSAGVRSLDIARREADMAVRFARPQAADLVCRKLGEVGFALYASRDYLSARGAPARGGGLAGQDLVGFRGAPAATSPFFMGESLEGARFALRCDSPALQRLAAAQGLGIAELACFTGDAEPDLVRLWPQAEPLRRTCWLIVHQDMRRAARVKAVAAAVEDAFRGQRGTLQASGMRPDHGGGP